MEGIRIKSPERYLSISLMVLIILIFLFILALIFFIFQGDKDIISTLNQFYLILFVILVILLVALISVSMIFTILFTKGSIEKGAEKYIMELSAEDIRAMNDEERKHLLQRLKANKERIEYLIKLAESKYHKRKLDEESFREIVRDQQKKMMEIEAKISEIEKEIKKLKKGK